MKKVIFTLLVFLGAAFVVSAQTSYCDSLITQIKTMAERHVQNNENMKTEFIVSTYKDNSCGLSNSQLAEIYEKHYIFIKNESSNKWKNFIPRIDWFYWILIFLLGISNSVVRKWITTLIDKIGASLYSKFSGSRLFRRKALKKYKKSLFKNNEKVKISFRRDRPLNMADIFIPLKVTDTTDNIQFEIEQAISMYEKVVVLGDPGSGKSMFCKNILFKYSKGQLKSERIPVLVELHRLSDKSFTISTLLEKSFINNDFPNSSKFLTQCLKSGNLFILFDGYDEINSNERKRVTDLINDFIRENNKCQYVITSRIAVYKNEFENVTNKTLELVDFDQQQIRKFLHSWGTEMPEGKSINQLMQILQDRPKILLLATNPLMLTIVAYLYTDTLHILPHSRSEFYDKATDVLLSPKDGIEDKYDYRDKSLILQHLALTSQDESQDELQDRKLIHYTNVFKEIEKILPNIKRDKSDIQPILKEIVERSGLLITVDRGEYYQFAHLTMQEYFSAKQLIDKQGELLERFKKDKQTWRETVKLWCGLANDTTRMISDLYEIDPVIAFECIADARSIKPETANKIIYHFEELLSNPVKCNIEIEKVFGVLASDVRPRGREILEMLKLKMELCKDNEQLLTIANALSYTYLPEAAKIISTHCSKNIELYNCLIKMGDIAIDELLKLAKQSDINALLGIKKISTPRAAVALQSLILDDDKEINRYAAWFLADLIFIPNITNAVREYKLTQAELKEASDEWAWQPFKTQEPLNSNLPFIIGRIVHLMSLPIKFEQGIDFTIDGKIAIPVIINQFPSFRRKSWKIDDINELGLVVEEINWIKKECLKYGDSFFFNDLLRYDFELHERKYLSNKQPPHINDFLLKFIDKEKYPIFFMISNSLQSGVFEISRYRFGTKLDWTNLFRTDTKRDYDFDTSWHYRMIFALFTILTISSIFFCGYSIWHSESSFTLWNIVQGIGGLIMIYNVIAYTFYDFDYEGEFYENPHNLLIRGVLGFIGSSFELIGEIFGKGKFEKDILIHLPTIIWTPFLFYYNFLLLKCFLPITVILIIAVAIIALCILLAVIGARLERISNNPFKGLKEILLARNKK
ncbi:MAG: NACHT domain-containing protein [Tannerella sp.]|jgi:hypothetical protein|nr:NACHT domain-containing protein [Tannerella sp.]